MSLYSDFYYFLHKTEYRHRRQFFLRLTSLLLLSLSLLTTGFLLRHAQEIRNRAAVSTPIPLLVEYKFNSQTGEISISRSIKLPGLNKKIPNIKENKYTYQLDQSLNGQTVSSQNVTFVDQVNGENFPQDTSSTSAVPIYHFKDPIALVNLAYYPGSKQTFHKDNFHYSISTNQLSETVQTNAFDSIPETTIAPTNQYSIQSAPTDEPTLDLLFISNGYSDSSQFTQDAQTMFQYLLTIPPFKTYANFIKVHYLYNQEDLNCTRPSSIPRLINCDLYLIYQVASGHLYDSIIVIDNSNDYGGAGYLGQNVAVTYRDTTALANQVLVHELGHSFGSLSDEYSYGTDYPLNASTPWANCDWNPCTKWLNTPNSGCFLTCGYTNLSRPTFNDSVMRTLYPQHGVQYGPVDETTIGHILQTYLNPIFQGDFNVDAQFDYQDIQSLSSNHPSPFAYNELVKAYGHSENN